MNLSHATVVQVLVPIEDYDRGMAFYRDILGIPFLFAAPPQMAFFVCGSVRLLVGVMPPGQNARCGSVIYFQVSDIQAVFSTLRLAGVAFVSNPHMINRSPKSELWLAEFNDPDGNHLALMSEVPIDR